MLDITEADAGPAQELDELTLSFPPPLILAGSDEEETWEPHLVRGID